MEKRKSFIQGVLAGALGVAILVLIVVSTGILPVSSDRKEAIQGATVIAPETETKLWKINNLIEKMFLYDDEIDYDALQNYLIKGYVAGLGDPYSTYYDEKQTKSLLENTAGEFGGVGVTLTQDASSKVITVVSMYKNSPGEKAGLQAGDILYKVNGKDITGQDLDMVVTDIRGEKGTTVELTILRGDERKEHTFKVVRDIIEIITVEYKMLQGNIGYIVVSEFEEATCGQFEKAIEELTKQGMKKMIIDLRNNPGGSLSAVCDMVDLILPKGTIVYTKDKYGNREDIDSDDEHQLDIPMAVLINGNSASASEIFAGAIQDYKKGTLVGTTTYGKGIVQQIFDLQDGTCLKLTISEYFTPNGRNIHGIGIKPDIEVEYKYDENNPTADNQLDAAIKCLK